MFLYDDDDDERARESTRASRSAQHLAQQPQPAPACCSKPTSSCARAAPRGCSCHRSRLRALPGRERVDLGAPGAHAGALRAGDAASARVRGRPRAHPPPSPRSRSCAGGNRRHARKLHAAAPECLGPVRPQARPGGMIDIEFTVQYLVLALPAPLPSSTGNLGNIALLHLAAAHGLIPADLGRRGCRRLPRVPPHPARRAAERRAVRACAARAGRGQAEAVRTLWRTVLGPGAGP